MALNVTTQGQGVIECNLCQEPVSFFCRRCGVNLCDPCALLHLRVKTKLGHDVVEFANKDDDDSCFCDTHPKHECSAYCETCDLPICPLCVSVKHKSHELSDLHDKIEELLKNIAKENDRFQSFRHELERIMDYTIKQLSSLSSDCQKEKDEVTARGKELHLLIDNHVKKLHEELDDLKNENEAVLQKQKHNFEEMVGKIDEINWKSTQLQKSKNVTEMQKFKRETEEQKTFTEIAEQLIPSFHYCRIDDHHMQTFWGYIEINPEMIMSKFENNSIAGTVSVRKVLEVPTVTSITDTGNNNRLCDLTITDDKKVWVGGYGNELKLVDIQGNVHRTVTLTCYGVYICMYKKQVVFSDQNDDNEYAVKKISDDDDDVVTMFMTGEWEPKGITSSASGDILVCLLKDFESKVVRYSSTGTVLQEIQYDSQSQPLYQWAWYIAENINGDIIVTDNGVVTTVDGLGTFRYSYSGKESYFDPYGVTTDSFGHIFVTDSHGNKIHMLGRDGQFLRYIIPEGGIEAPRAACMIDDTEMMIGECVTGLAKIIKFIEDEK